MKKIILILITLLLVAGLVIKDTPHKDSVNYTEDMFIAQINDTPINFALSFYGVEEAFTNGKSNPLVVSFFKDFADWVTNSTTTAWCSAFVNTIFSSTGYEYSGNISARSWLTVGTEIKTPEVGDVVVFWRDKKDSWKGHVGLFIAYSQDKKSIYVLGGNQSNKVSINLYPVSQLLGFRRPKSTRAKSNTESQFSGVLKLKLNQDEGE